LLDVCRINARKFPLRVETVDFVEVLREAAESFTPEAEFHHSSIQVTSPEHLEGQWDRLAIEQIVSNLISNAIKYGAGAPVEVELREASDGIVILEVRDRGIGIAPEDQERIFGRFEQGATPGGRSAGFGVGLWLVRSLIQVHGGEINVVSVPERGSTFTVRLPRDARQFNEESSSA
jgi:signal transduction histidine kinase